MEDKHSGTESPGGHRTAEISSTVGELIDGATVELLMDKFGYDREHVEKVHRATLSPVWSAARLDGKRVLRHLLGELVDQDEIYVELEIQSIGGRRP